MLSLKSKEGVPGGETQTHWCVCASSGWHSEWQLPEAAIARMLQELSGETVCLVLLDRQQKVLLGCHVGPVRWRGAQSHTGWILTLFGLNIPGPVDLKESLSLIMEVTFGQQDFSRIM